MPRKKKEPAAPQPPKNTLILVNDKGDVGLIDPLKLVLAQPKPGVAMVALPTEEGGLYPIALFQNVNLSPVVEAPVETPKEQ